VRVYTTYRVGTQRPSKRRSNFAAVVVFLLILLATSWLVWRKWKQPANKASQSTPTNSPAAKSSMPQLTNKPSARVIATNVLLPATKSAAVLDAQVALDRLAISPGSIDGVLGSQSRAALRAFQRRENLPLTGELDADTRARLALSQPVFARWIVSEQDISRLLPIGSTWLAKSEQPRLEYESLLELVAERTHSHPNLIKRLNPAVVWDQVAAGTELLVPATERERPPAKAAYLEIRLRERTLQAFDANGQLLAHFPCSIASRVEKRPVGELHVEVTAPSPNYTFNPEVFPESAEARELGRKLILPPGPNNPVGTAWIGLDKPGYGIHGTPRPEDVGRTESHGCFRLANWNAEYLLQLVTVGTPVRVEP
jgi:lipoprotein-anchoring transpeptidase ErfK/SrfK